MRTLALVGAFLLLYIAGGTAWYAVVEHFGLSDGLFMAVTTLTTVGYGEVQPLDTSGRLFTIAYVLSGVGILFYAATVSIEIVVVRGLAERLGGRRSRGRVRRMHEHTVICGFGRVGREVAEELAARHLPFVVIDLNERAPGLDTSVVTVVGDATDESNLRAAGIDRARALVAAADSDVENTYIVLTARALNPRLFIVARAGSETAERRMRAAGADRVVSPYRLGGRRMAMSAAHPTLSDVMEHVDSRRTSDAIVAEIELRDPLSPLIGVTIGVALPVDVRVMGLDRDETGLLVDPSPDTTLQADDRLFVYGTPAAVERFAANAGSRAPAPGEIRART